MKTVVLMALLFLSCARGQDVPTGLEVGNTAEVRVLIEELNKTAARINLTSEIIEARVARVLRQSGIKPTFEKGTFPYLYVNVHTVGDSKPVAFSVSLSYKRPVTFVSANTSINALGVTWTTGTLGLAGDSKYILDAIGRQTELFCNAFLKANGK